MVLKFVAVIHYSKYSILPWRRCFFPHKCTAADISCPQILMFTECKHSVLLTIAYIRLQDTLTLEGESDPCHSMTNSLLRARDRVDEFLPWGFQAWYDLVAFKSVMIEAETGSQLKVAGKRCRTFVVTWITHAHPQMYCLPTGVCGYHAWMNGRDTSAWNLHWNIIHRE